MPSIYVGPVPTLNNHIVTKAYADANGGADGGMIYEDEAGNPYYVLPGEAAPDVSATSMAIAMSIAL